MRRILAFLAMFLIAIALVATATACPAVGTPQARAPDNLTAIASENGMIGATTLTNSAQINATPSISDGTVNGTITITVTNATIRDTGPPVSTVQRNTLDMFTTTAMPSTTITSWNANADQETSMTTSSATTATLKAVARNGEICSYALNVTLNLDAGTFTIASRLNNTA